MARLRNAGLVVSRHGPGGGYILARPTHRITVAEVFQAFDDPSDFANRPLNAGPLWMVEELPMEERLGVGSMGKL